MNGPAHRLAVIDRLQQWSVGRCEQTCRAIANELQAAGQKVATLDAQAAARAAALQQLAAEQDRWPVQRYQRLSELLDADVVALRRAQADQAAIGRRLHEAEQELIGARRKAEVIDNAVKRRRRFEAERRGVRESAATEERWIASRSAP